MAHSYARMLTPIIKTFTTWICGKCGIGNKEDGDRCISCQAKRTIFK